MLSDFFLYNLSVNANGVIVHTNQLLTNGIKSQFLKNGSQVLVRVLNELPNGKYEGSVAGIRINFSSNKPLVPGSSFTASVVAKNGIIQLVPNQSESETVQQNQNNILLQNQNLTALLNSLGLPADSLSANLLQQMQQLEMKFDLSFMNKIRNLAVKFKGKEKLASQLLMILAEKGIEADKDSLEKLLQEIFGTFGQDDSQNEYNEQKQQNHQNRDYKLLNEFNSKKGKWYFLPFEILDLSQSKNEVTGVGCIKLLYNSENTNLLMMNLDCAYNQKNYLFNLFFEANKCSSLAVNINPVNQNEIKLITGALKEAFMKKNINLDVFWADREKLEGSACGFENLYSFEGEI